jgi:glycosyltransferase involved in cell wall biosynthesis
LIKGRDIIVHGLQSLDSPIGSNCINIAHEFAKNNRVLYVNYPIDRFTLIRKQSNPLIQKRKKVLKGEIDDLVQINDNLWNLNPRTILESISKVTFRPIFSFVNKINNRRYAKAVVDAVKKLELKNIIIFNDSDFYRAFYFKELIQPQCLVYYTRDNMRETDFFRKNGAFFEDRLMSKSDLVVSNSVYLNDIAKKNNQNSIYVGQGCDITLFNKDHVKNIPDDMSTIKQPIIGYIGALKSTRLDINVLEYIAVTKPEWSLVLVGPEDDTFTASKLHDIPNVYFLGSKNENQLPTYLNYFDVALNPQALNELTIGNYPRKIDEYLAMGKPVVATKTKTMEVFKDFTYLATSELEYVELILKALNEDNESKIQARIKFAHTHTWENNIKAIYEAIYNTNKENEIS